jgi:hypothetical protein
VEIISFMGENLPFSRRKEVVAKYENCFCGKYAGKIYFKKHNEQS